MDKIGGVQLKQAQFVGRAGQRLRQPWRAAVKFGRGQDFLYVRGKVREFGRQVLRLSEQGDALPVFADFLCLAAFEIVQTRAAVRVDVPVGLVFFVEILQH
ncbi:putative regulatory RecX domain protein [Neisseria meningitidis 73696]|nr:putative regulatory RecX domain protein [Neisseria meningitidis 73696]